MDMKCSMSLRRKGVLPMESVDGANPDWGLYLRRVGERCSTIVGQCGGCDNPTPIRVELEDVYVPMRRAERPWPISTDTELSPLGDIFVPMGWAETDKEADDQRPWIFPSMANPDMESGPTAFLEILRRRRRVVVLGAPLSGRALFLKYVALWLSRAAASDERTVREQESSADGPPIPILITVREPPKFCFIETSDQRELRARLDSVIEYISGSISEEFGSAAPSRHMVSSLLERGHAVLLLDDPSGDSDFSLWLLSTLAGCWKRCRMVLFASRTPSLLEIPEEWDCPPLVEYWLDEEEGSKALARQWLVGLLGRSPEPEDAARVVAVTGRLTDPDLLPIRFGCLEIVGAWGDPRLVASDRMVVIEPGRFWQGSDSNVAHANERPARQITLTRPYAIDRYLTTNQDFRPFVDEGGYLDQRFWSEEGWAWRAENDVREPWFWSNHEWNGPNFPIVCVSWYEAEAYCRWRTVNESTPDRPYRLPTEAEWERAARGDHDRREYPWGDSFDKDRCNTEHGGLGRTSPVGLFPNGSSPFGLEDMTGNVCQWCSNWINSSPVHLWRSPHSYIDTDCPDRDPTGPHQGELRALRGGSWQFVNFERCSSRLGHSPGDRYPFIGFRSARSL